MKAGTTKMGGSPGLKSPMEGGQTILKNGMKLMSTRIDPTRFERPNAGSIQKLNFARGENG
jgi:hypothetical protein